MHLFNELTFIILMLTYLLKPVGYSKYFYVMIITTVSYSSFNF